LAVDLEIPLEVLVVVEVTMLIPSVLEQLVKAIVVEMALLLAVVTPWVAVAVALER
jgi:hypothetical protein